MTHAMIEDLVPIVRKMARRAARNGMDADDLEQQVLFRLLTAIPEGTEIRKPSSYAWMTVQNVLRGWLRDPKNRTATMRLFQDDIRVNIKDPKCSVKHLDNQILFDQLRSKAKLSPTEDGAITRWLVGEEAPGTAERVRRLRARAALRAAAG